MNTKTLPAAFSVTNSSTCSTAAALISSWRSLPCRDRSRCEVYNLIAFETCSISSLKDTICFFNNLFVLAGGVRLEKRTLQTVELGDTVCEARPYRSEISLVCLVLSQSSILSMTIHTFCAFRAEDRVTSKFSSNRSRFVVVVVFLPTTYS